MVYLILFWEYFLIGVSTIGGGYAMLPRVQQVVLNRGWLTEQELINFVGIAESTPGPFAINLATFVGMNVGKTTSLGIFGGFLGALVATFAVVLPSIVVIIIVMNLFTAFRSSKVVQGALGGIRPVVVGLILSAVISVGSKVILPNLNWKEISADGFSQFNWISLIIMAVFFPLTMIKIKGKKIHPIFLILGSAVVGIIIFGVCGVTQ